MSKYFSVIILLFFSLFFVGCDTTNNIVRIHIRANSNSTFDQEVKYEIRDEIVDYITPLISDCKDSNQVKIILNSNLKNIENITDKILIKNNCNYISSAQINNEFFPTRKYDDVSFPADYYDALIIKLGSGKGDNWWCVAYPPLCFVGNENSQDLTYKSKLVELVKKILG